MKEQAGSRQWLAMAKLAVSLSERYFAVADGLHCVIAYIPNYGTYTPPANPARVYQQLAHALEQLEITPESE